MPSDTVHKLTPRSFIAGYVLALLLCAVNSYLTLSFGIMEEGPAIAALFFFAAFFLSRNKITTSEMVIVATMGSAGGSLGFMSNFFAAMVMVGQPYSTWEMITFIFVTSIIGLLSVVILRQILIIQDSKLPEDQRLAWVGSKAVKGVIDALVSSGDTLQPRYLAFFTVAAVLYVIFNNDGGIGWFPAAGMISIFGFSAYGAGIAFSPFVIGGSYLMGMRTCVGFLIGGITLLVFAPYLPKPAAPQSFVWPGTMFLVTSGLTALAMNWRIVVSAIGSLFTMQTNLQTDVDNDPIMSKPMLIACAAFGLIITVACLYWQFNLTMIVILSLIVIGGIVLNLVAVRAAAQTAFNPARVMGILMMGINAMLGANTMGSSLTGAGMIAGSGSQGGNLTGDMAYGFWYKLPARWQFWTQAATLIGCALVSAFTFKLINANFVISLDAEGALPAPVAKIWATMAMLFDPNANNQLPPFAVEAMWIGGIGGVIWAMIENHRKVRGYFPSSIGFGLALILPQVYSYGFFFGGVLMWYVLGKFLKIKDITLNTIAISCIIGEGVGGILTATLTNFGLIGG